VPMMRRSGRLLNSWQTNVSTSTGWWPPREWPRARVCRSEGWSRGKCWHFAEAGRAAIRRGPLARPGRKHDNLGVTEGRIVDRPARYSPDELLTVHQIHRLPLRPTGVLVENEKFADQSLVEHGVDRRGPYVSGPNDANRASLNHGRTRNSVNDLGVRRGSTRRARSARWWRESSTRRAETS